MVVRGYLEKRLVVKFLVSSFGSLDAGLRSMNEESVLRVLEDVPSWPKGGVSVWLVMESNLREMGAASAKGASSKRERVGWIWNT